MAIAYDTSGKTSGTGTTLTLSHTCTGTNRALVVTLWSVGGNSPTVTYNGVPMTKVIGGFNALSFILFNPDAGTHDIIASVGGSQPFAMAAASYTGVDPLLDASSSTISGTPTTAIITTTRAGCWIVGAFGVTKAGAVAGITSDVTDRQLGADVTDGTHYRVLLCDSNGAVTAGAQSIEYTTDGTGYSAATISLAPFRNTLALDTGAYTLTGKNVLFPLGWKIALVKGAYILTGNNVAFVNGFNYMIDLAVGAFTLTGKTLLFKFNNLVVKWFPKSKQENSVWVGKSKSE